MYGLIVVFLSLALFGCQEDRTRSLPTDFETLMGKEFPAWDLVQTPEDFENLKFFKEVYDRNIGFLSTPSDTFHIPKVLHFIWVGPKPFPKESVINIRSWIAHHPDWKIKFWTDRDRPLPHPRMELVRIRDHHFSSLFDCYNKSENYGEKSDILRYEILYQEGGIYVDHDVQCLRSFETLSKTFDFYCGMELPYPSSLPSSLLPTNNILGSIPHHPILRRSLAWLQDNWDRIDREYPGRDNDAVFSRIVHRTFIVLSDSFKALANQEGTRDIALPTFYFNAPHEKLAMFSRHQYQGTWIQNETAFEKMVRERLMKLAKKNNKILLAFVGLACLNCAGFGFLLGKLRHRTHKSPP